MLCRFKECNVVSSQTVKKNIVWKEILLEKVWYLFPKQTRNKQRSVFPLPFGKYPQRKLTKKEIWNRMFPFEANSPLILFNIKGQFTQWFLCKGASQSTIYIFSSQGMKGSRALRLSSWCVRELQPRCSGSC